MSYTLILFRIYRETKLGRIDPFHDGTLYPLGTAPRPSLLL